MDDVLCSASQSDADLARLRAKVESLQAQLEESQETLRAIREGEVDALVVSTPEGERIFTLQGGEHPYRALIEQMLEGAATLTPAGVVHYSNQRFAKMLRLPLERVMGRRIEDFVAPADLALLAAMLSEGGGRAELTLTAGDATELPALVSAVALRAEGPAAICLVVADLTERKRQEARIHQLNDDLEERVIERTAQLAAANRELEAEVEERKQVAEALRESEERYRLLVDGAKDHAIFMLDPEGRVVTWNTGAERVKGYAAQDIVGRHFSRFYAPEDVTAGKPQRELAIAIEQGQCVAEGWRVRKDGSRFWAAVSITPIRGEAGKLRGFAKLVQDITERKRAEEALAHAKAAAEAANVAKSQFLASMSHELRTPMNAILGMTDLALGTQLPATVRDYLQTSKDSADLLLELLNEILDFSRIEAGRFELESVPFQLRKTVEQVAKTLSIRAYEKGLELVCHVAGEAPDLVVGDPLRLRQVLMNLVGNAVKFTPKGEVVVRTAVEQRTAEAVVLRFSVSDTGIGIAAEKLDKIFAPFTQADSSTSRRFGGTGLGLAISQRLVNLMGGQIRVESRPGEGSTFHFTLTMPVAEHCGDAGEAVAGDQDVFRGLPALVIAESATSRKILQQTLASWSMPVDEAPDVPTALTKIHEAAAAGRAYRVVLADAVMPGIDGFTLVGWLAQESRLAGAVILMLSATDRQNYPDRCRELKMPCLEKPISRSVLFNAIAKAVGAEGAAPPLDRGKAPGVLPIPARILRILVAEDTPANQMLVRHLLGKRGHKIQIVEDGRQALGLVQAEDFDVVLMDAQMPEMDGFEATAAIRKLNDPRKASLPIIAMTAHALKGDRERCLAAGMDSYLSKPIKGEALIELVERLAGKGDSQAAGLPVGGPETRRAPGGVAGGAAVFNTNSRKDMP